jgi:hypothetical protein
MRVIDIILEMASEAVDNLKSVLLSKIKELPADEQNIKTLREIEDLLRDANAGGRIGLIKKDLKSIPDPEVHKAQKILATYILGIDATPSERQELFSKWRDDSLVNKDQLFSGDRVGFAEVFNGYGTNGLITELVETLMKINAVGHGKGEFALSVLSQSINKPAGSKGDLILRRDGKNIQVEVKTSDRSVSVDPETGKEKVSDSSARFGDQEVSVADGYHAAAKKLNDFVMGVGAYKGRTGYKLTGLSGYGVNLNKAVNFVANSTPQDKKIFMGLAKTCISLIFGKIEGGRESYRVRLKKNIDAILKAIESGDNGEAAQAYSIANFNYYMAKKHDDGVLFISIPQQSFVWYDSAENLPEKGLRLRSDTISISATNDVGRAVYPQMYVEPTTHGADSAAKALKKIKFGKRTDHAEFEHAMHDWITKLAHRRRVTSKPEIKKMAKVATELRMSGMDTNQMVSALEQQFPSLQVKYARPLPQTPQLNTTDDVDQDATEPPITQPAELTQQPTA